MEPREPAGVAAGVESGEDAFVILLLVGHQVPEDAGELVGDDGVGADRPHASAHSSVVFAEHAFVAGQAGGGVAQHVAQPLLAGHDAAPDDFAAADFVVGTEPHPRAELAGAAKGAPADADLAQQREDDARRRCRALSSGPPRCRGKGTGNMRKREDRQER